MVDDAKEMSIMVSDKDKESRNKRKFVFELPPLFVIEPLSGCPQSNEVETPPNEHREDAITGQLLELLNQNLSTIFQSAIKRIVECGYSEETAERVILMCGIYHGSKDVVSNIVDGALAFLRREEDFDNATHFTFANLPSLVDYALLEMLCVLREVKPALTVVEAMWCLLITDLNLVHACTREGDQLVELCSQESPGDSSSSLKLPQSRTEASENTHSKPSTPVAQTLQSRVHIAGAAPQEPESKGKGSFAPLPKVEDKSKAAILEDKSGDGRKAINSKKDSYKRKTFQFEKNSRSCTGKNIKANITAWGNLVLDKKQDSSDSSDATKKSSHTKVNTSVKSNKPSAKATDTSSVPPVQDNVNEKDPNLLAMEPKSSIKAPLDKTTISSAVPDYYAGIPYDEHLGKYVPQNEKDEAILLLTSRLKTLQKELQGWSDWANEKVMQATRRLGKDLAELKMLRQEKEDAEKILKETKMLEEDARERIMAMEQSVVNTNYIFETTNSYVKRLEKENVELKKEREAVVPSKNVKNKDDVYAKEQEAVKKCQAADLEKHFFEEDLSTLKKKQAALQQQQEEANKVMDQFEVLSKHEERVKQRFLQQWNSLKAEKEQTCVKGKAMQDNFIEKVERNMCKCKENKQKLESEVSQLTLQLERAKIEALKRDIPQMAKGLAAYAECSGSTIAKMERECVMCMNEHRSVLFLPCAHQVLCEDCSVLHQNKEMKECPSCRIPIKKRISVRFPDSI